MTIQFIFKKSLKLSKG